MAATGDDEHGGRGEPVDPTEDATHRTQLAGERTFLAWWRTGLTALAVSIAAGRLVPAVAGGPQTLYTIDGVLFAAVGIFILVYSRRRGHEVGAAAERGRYQPPDERVLAIITAAAALGGLILAVLVIVGR